MLWLVICGLAIDQSQAPTATPTTTTEAHTTTTAEGCLWDQHYDKYSKGWATGYHQLHFNLSHAKDLCIQNAYCKAVTCNANNICSLRGSPTFRTSTIGEVTYAPTQSCYLQALTTTVAIPSTSATVVAPTTTTTVGATTTVVATTTAVTTTDASQYMVKIFHGMLSVRVSNATRFIAEQRMPQLLKVAIASWLDINASWVQNVSLSLIHATNAKGARLLSEHPSGFQLQLGGNVRIDFDVFVFEDSEDPYVLATVIMDRFDSASNEEVSIAINKVLESGFFGDTYELVVVSKDLEASELPPRPPPSQALAEDSSSAMVITIITLSFSLSACILGILAWRWRNKLFARQGGYRRRRTSSINTERELLVGAGPLGALTLEELLSPPAAISVREKLELRRLISAFCCNVDTDAIDVFISYALANREEDVEGSGPGLYYVAALLKALYSQGLNCVVPAPGLLERSDFLSMIGECTSFTKVLLVVETQELFHCNESMQEIHAAQSRSFDIRRLRYDGNLWNLPQADQESQLHQSDDDVMRRYDSIEKMSYFDLPLFPDPPSTILKDIRLPLLQTVALRLKVENSLVRKRLPTAIKIGHANGIIETNDDNMLSSNSSCSLLSADYIIEQQNSAMHKSEQQNSVDYKSEQQNANMLENEDLLASGASSRSLPALPPESGGRSSQKSRKRWKTSRKCLRDSEQDAARNDPSIRSTSAVSKLPMERQEEGEQSAHRSEGTRAVLRREGTLESMPSVLSKGSAEGLLSKGSAEGLVYMFFDASLASATAQEKQSVNAPALKNERKSSAKGQRPSTVKKSRTQNGIVRASNAQPRHSQKKANLKQAKA